MEKSEVCLSHPPKSIHGQAKQEEEEKEEKHDKKAYILQLPDHIIVEIFCKIPTKTLILCQCVCKDWHRFLSDIEFMRGLFSRTHTCLLVQGNPQIQCPWGWQIKHTHFLVGLKHKWNGNHVALKLCRDPIFRTGDIHIVSSYNGLLLCEDRLMGSVSLYISNPITAESLAIPKPSKIRFTNCYSGFGYSPISDVYKVVLINKPNNESKEPGARVLTVGCTTWRIIEGFEIFALSYGTHHNGFIHWLGRRMDSLGIFAFDVETEHFQQFPLPPCQFDMDNVPNYKLGVMKSCISLTVHSLNSLTVWMMKEYGVKESWTQELEICKNSGYCRSYYFKSVNFTEEGKVLILGRDGCLRVYFPNTGGFAWIHIDGISWNSGALVHVPSFVSLKDVIRG
ncbi:hypothetical protein ACFX13_032376 [Malus domestica]|uniref:F-box domain-containing protein n=1 Tax=Malus domestica TaxID=3750 RepID=A0A498JZZ5_MALDO|nr:F-box protein At3g07870-like [Malus sylvestris]RXI00588.1 hypothetical protein DVH24_000822 [Malus domestica]